MRKRYARSMVVWIVVACGCGSGATSTGVGGAGAGTTSSGTGTASTGTASTGTGMGGAGTSSGVGTGGASTGSTSSGLTSTGTGTSTGGACTVTLSGSETGTFSCTVTAAWSSGNNVTGVAITPSSALPSGVQLAEGGGTVSGQIAVMTYPLASFVKGGYSVVNEGNTVWGSPPDNTLGGTQSMSITSVTTDIDTSTAKTYTLHGTFDATCPYENGTPDPGTSVTVHIDF